MLIQPICTHPTRFFGPTIIRQRVPAVQRSPRAYVSKCGPTSISACSLYQSPTAKVSGKTAVCSERQHKWAKLSVWGPSDLSERIPTCSVTFSFIYWSSSTFDLFTLKTLEDFPECFFMWCNNFTSAKLWPRNEQFISWNHALSLELAFLSNLFICCIWVLLLQQVQQELKQLLFLRHRLPFTEEDIVGVSHHSCYLLCSFQVKQWKKTCLHSLFLSTVHQQNKPWNYLLLSDSGFFVPPGKNRTVLLNN